jgi:HSP20 family molecular chaperone IbpA
LPKEQKKIDPKMEEISTYNGDKTDKYNWSQGLTDVIVQIPLPDGTKPRDLDVKIKSKHLSVSLKGKEPIV